MPQIKAKSVSNYELFYDLVFVFITTNLTRFIHGPHVNAYSIFVFIIGNLFFLSLWAMETLYLNKYGQRDLLDVITIIASMFAIGNMGLHMDLNFDTHGVPFNAWVTIAYAILWAQYYFRGKKIERTASFKLTQKVLFALVIWGLILTGLAYFKIFTSNILSASLLLVYVIWPLLFSKKYNHAAINFPHLVERYQLITIITFGETVIATLTTFPDPISPAASLTFAGMAMLFMLYNSHTQLNIEHHQIADTTLYTYAHLGIILGLNFFTVGLETIGSGHHPSIGYSFLLAGIALFYFCLLATARYNTPEFRPSLKDIGFFILVVLAGLLAIYLTRHWLVIALICFDLMALILVRHVFYFRKNS